MTGTSEVGEPPVGSSAPRRRREGRLVLATALVGLVMATQACGGPDCESTEEDAGRAGTRAEAVQAENAAAEQPDSSIGEVPQPSQTVDDEVRVPSPSPAPSNPPPGDESPAPVAPAGEDPPDPPEDEDPAPPEPAEEEGSTPPPSEPVASPPPDEAPSVGDPVGTDPSTVDPVQVSPDVFFLSTWSTALGGSDEAITDGGRWREIVCSSAELLEVVDMRGFPDYPPSWPNRMLRTRIEGEGCRNVRGPTGDFTLGPGESMGWRVLVHVPREAGEFPGHLHNIQWWEGAIPLTWGQGYRGGQQWIGLGGSDTPYYTVTVPYGGYYVLDLLMHAESETRFRIEARIIDGRDRALLHTTNHFRNEAGQALGRHVWRWPDPSFWNRLMVGAQGPLNPRGQSLTFSYYGGVCAVRGGWPNACPGGPPR